MIYVMKMEFENEQIGIFKIIFCKENKILDVTFFRIYSFDSFAFLLKFQSSNLKS